MKDGAHLTVSHALRCTCPKCERIVKWEDADSQGIVSGACCEMVFRLFPWSVKVRFEDSQPELLLPPHQQRDFPLGGDLRDYGPVVGPDPSSPGTDG